MQHVDTDILISRVVDGRAGPSDWESFEAIAASEAGLWKDLALAQRDHALLGRQVQRIAARAGTVDLPSVAEHAEGEIPPTLSFQASLMSRRSHQVAAWAGWAAAAALAIAFVGRGNLPSPGGNGMDTPTAGLAGAPIQSAADALTAYLNKGREDGTVIGEQPQKQVVTFTPAKGGKGYEVVFIRGILERARVDDLYRFTSDESGAAAAVPVRPQQASGSPNNLPSGEEPKKFRKPAL